MNVYYHFLHQPSYNHASTKGNVKGEPKNESMPKHEPSRLFLSGGWILDGRYAFTLQQSTQSASVRSSSPRTTHHTFRRTESSSEPRCN